MKKRKACLIGNPNVGKSSIFNSLTGSLQHTGNWTGKTVSNEVGEFVYQNTLWELVDLPGTYSLMCESVEEKIASDYVLGEDYDLAIVVADATNLERSMEILLEVMDVQEEVLVCLNLMDEARKRNILIDKELLEKRLGIPVILTSAKEGVGLEELLEQMNHYSCKNPFSISHKPVIERFCTFFLKDTSIIKKGKAIKYLVDSEWGKEEISLEKKKVLSFYQKMISKAMIRESYHENALKVLENVIERKEEREKKEDKIWNTLFSNRWTSFPIMLLLLFGILWLTIYFSNIPSSMLFDFFEFLEELLYSLLSFLPEFLLNPLIYGGYRTLYWVVSVMLPPMLIFFPLFSLLEDYGLLPRIAFNLDQPFAKCGSCGKQSLTMCMGLGCNAVGVTGTRIMESKKMRILSILTNVFMPCNGRFPAMIAIIGMFFVQNTSFLGSLYSAFILSLVIVLGILLTFLVTYFLNFFILKNEKPIFILELPSFRKPKIFKTIYFSIKEKALHVLKRAMIVSFPAGLLIYFLANVTIHDFSILTYLRNFFEPFGLLIGLDGAILLAFLLGLPANEIVIPILLLLYSGGSVLTSYESLDSLKQVFLLNHWTILTALNFLIFSLCHFPCATTLLTIKKETHSWFYTILAFVLPTFIGVCLCFLMNLLF